MIRSKGIRVAPRSTQEIRKIASRYRQVFDVIRGFPKEKLDMIEVLELLLPQVLENLDFIVVDDHELGNDHGRTHPEKTEILVKNSTYLGALRGEGRDIFTLAHELGHLILHKNAASFARANTHLKGREIQAYEDSEWQADQFAAEILMPYELCMHCTTPMEIAFKFGVSMTAAEYRFKKTKGVAIRK